MFVLIPAREKGENRLYGIPDDLLDAVYPFKSEYGLDELVEYLAGCTYTKVDRVMLPQNCLLLDIEDRIHKHEGC